MSDAPSRPYPEAEAVRRHHAEEWQRQIINAGGDENVALQAVTLAALNGLFDHLGVAQPPTKPWVCCNCDADLSCGACGVEQPNDSAYYEGIVKENERLNYLLADAQRIIAEYQASTEARADVAAQGLPGARVQPPSTDDAEREWNRRISAFHEALSRYPDSYEALHHLWNSTVAGSGGAIPSTEGK